MNLTIGIVGAGQMGQGIALAFLQKKFKVLLYDISASIKEKAQQNLKHKLSLNPLTQSFISNLYLCENLKDLRPCHLIIECIAEDYAVKKSLYKDLNQIVSNQTIIASNTSSLSISTLAQSFKDPSTFLGIHFFNPVSKMPLVEVVTHDQLSGSILNVVNDLIKYIEKVPVQCKDTPGFIVNRLLIPLLNQAFYLYENGIASIEDIDLALMKGANFPMGPFALADFIGLDTCLHILNTFSTELNDESLKPCAILQEYVKKGELGRKTNKGFYDYCERKT